MAIVEPTDKAILPRLEARLKALDAAVRHNQEAPEESQKTKAFAKRGHGKVARRKRWPPRDNEESITLSSADVEVEEKRLRTESTMVDEDTTKVEMVYVLLMSFRATTPQGDMEEQHSGDEGLPVVELMLTEQKVEAEVVVFEKPSAF